MMGWLRDRQSLGIQPGLERIDALLDFLGNPHHTYESVHVTGTNGKGSVAALIAGALQLSGHRTGLYTSPHLVEFAERIQVDGDPISAEDLTELLERVKANVTIMDEAENPPTFFEIATTAAFTHFDDAGVTRAVVETGMGGLSDATNVIHPILAVITNVSLEHTRFLGDDIAAIAREKSGIIEPRVPVVTAATGEALVALRNAAADHGSTVVVIGEDYRYEPVVGGVIVSDGELERRFDVAADGLHQLENAALAVAACDVLRDRDPLITEAAVEKALADTPLPGRLERFDVEGVSVIVDGAHNPAAVRSVRQSLENSGTVFDLIVGFSADKEWVGMLTELLPLARRVWIVPIRSPRSLDPDVIALRLPHDMEFGTFPGFQQAYLHALDSGATDVLVTGSMFLAGEARAVMTGHGLSEVGGMQ